MISVIASVISLNNLSISSIDFFYIIKTPTDRINSKILVAYKIKFKNIANTNFRYLLIITDIHQSRMNVTFGFHSMMLDIAFLPQGTWC